MSLINKFYTQIKNVLEEGVFGVSLYDLSIILFAILFALFIRGIFLQN